ncbi:hypothetical protein CI102_4853 [Trichoderma harzianum]|nr:hypothetical protein CI102_4853 [Trichoderma harzianum]
MCQSPLVLTLRLMLCVMEVRAMTSIVLLVRSAYWLDWICSWLVVFRPPGRLDSVSDSHGGHHLTVMTPAWFLQRCRGYPNSSSVGSRIHNGSDPWTRSTLAGWTDAAALNEHDQGFQEGPIPPILQYNMAVSEADHIGRVAAGMM